MMDIQITILIIIGFIQMFNTAFLLLMFFRIEKSKPEQKLKVVPKRKKPMLAEQHY